MCFIKGLDTSGVAIGTIHDFGQAALPFGYLTCDGASLPRVGTYAALFAKIGTTFGFVDINHFNLPNKIGKTSIMPGTYTDAVSGSVTRVAGAVHGAEKHVVATAEMPIHTHTQDVHNHAQSTHNHTQSAHNHQANLLGGGGGPFAYEQGNNSGGDGTQQLSNVATTAVNVAATATNTAATATNQNTGGGTAHNNMQPTLVIGNVGIAYI
jgi:microcystin-dependent protein